MRNMKVSILISSLVSLSVAIDVAPVYPEDSDHSSSVPTITPSSVLTLTDITVPGAEDQVTHFVQVSPEDGKKSSKTEISSEASHGRQSAHSDFEERIRLRLQKEKQKLALKELALKSSSSRGKSRSYKLAETSEPERTSRFDSSFRDRSRSRYHHKTRDSPGYTNKDSASSSTSSRFKPSRTSYSTRNRFKSVITDRIDVVKPALLKPSISKPRYATSTRSEIPELTFKKFERPNVKKNFLNKYFPRPNILKNKNTEEREDGPLSIDNEEIRFERLLTTLDVSTSYPMELSHQYLEVATIRSPYTFNVEDNEKSTRFITITKSLTKTMDISPSKSFTSAPSSSINPSPSLSSTPLFDTNSIPPPENILATTSTPYDNINIQGSSDIEFLAPITLTTSLHEATPPLKTVTETLSTVETLVKKSILPVIIGDDITSLFTLSQTYSITRIVTAVKTVPPMDLFEFNPQQSFADFDTLFEEAGSENRESLLPGELEFSDQDNFGLEGPSIVKVAPPHEFLDDTKLDFIDQMEKHNNPDLVQLKGSAPSLESTLRGAAGPEESQRASLAQPTPSLPDQGLAALGITPEQLLYLQLLQNPLAALGLGGLQPQVITESSPVYKTEPVIETSVIKLFLGAKEYFTTLTNTQGVTVKTDYILATKTINSPTGLGGFTAGLEQPGLGLGLLPSYTVVTSPVTRDSLVTQTLTEQIRITFRNVPTLTTLTSTKVVSTQVTSFVTKTERVLPTANPLAGLLG